MTKFEKLDMRLINIEAIQAKQKEKWWSLNQLAEKLWIDNTWYIKAIKRWTMKRQTIERMVEIFNETSETTFDELVTK